VPFQLTAGQKAWYLVTGEVFGPKRLVTISREVAKRSRYIGEGAWLDADGNAVPARSTRTQGFSYIVFLDPKSQQKLVQLSPR
jgi:hypothetical protein